MAVPKVIFIVPYRDRVPQKHFFCKYMTYILQNDSDYEIYFSLQSDTRIFNRGAMKNIGFLAMKDKYPNDYKNITFVFNDVDTIPYKKLFDYQTTEGVIRHYYGFYFALGGIVSIMGSDFEKINGFPCYWGWGHEDNALLKRSQKHGITIDRSIFYKIGDNNILHLFDGMSRLITKNENNRFVHDNGYDGLRTIRNLNFNITIDDDDEDDHDDGNFIYVINITSFDTFLNDKSDNYYEVDLRDTTRQNTKLVINNNIQKSGYKSRFSLF
jgi:hypothetical protein